jgi:ribosomal protein S12 methylthiotransferase accessory factor
VQAHDMASGQVTRLPAQEVFLDHAAVTGEDLTCDARSTGCAAAPDTDEAAWRGLLECIEREAKAFWWHGGVAAHALPNSLIDAIAPRLLWWLERRERRFRLLGLVNDWGVPVVVAASSTPEGGQVAVGTAARFDVAEAALAAVTEMVQTEDALTRALQAGQEEAVAWAATGSMLTQPQFDPPWDGVPAGWTTTTEAALLARLIAVGLTAWWVEMTLPDDPLPSVRVVVPGLADMAGRLDCPRLRQAMDLPPNAPLILQEPTPF